MKSLKEYINEAKFYEFEVTFKRGQRVSGVKLPTKPMVVKARGVSEAIRKAAKQAGVPAKDAMVADTESVKRL